MVTDFIRLDKSVQYRGGWWIPGQPETVVSGTLSFSPIEGIKLELDGVILQETASGDSPHSVILGYSNHGTPITLHNCYLERTSNMYSAQKTTQTEWYVEQAFIGVNFESEDDFQFHSLEVHFAGLDEWGFRRCFDGEHGEFVHSQLNWHTQRIWYSDNVVRDYAGTSLSDFVDTYETTIRFELPKPVRVKLDDYEIGVFDWPGESVSHTESKVERQSWIHFHSEQQRRYDEWRQLVKHVQDFLTLMMDRATFPVAIRGRSEAAKLTLRDNAESLYSAISVLHRQAWPQPEIEFLHHGHMLFPLSTIDEQLGLYLRNWFSSADELRPVHNLYFSNLYNPYLYQESKFLGLTQALETYHRRRCNGQYQSNSEYRGGLYQRFVKVIPSDLESAFQASLKSGTLKYANEYSLIKRLKEITNRLSAGFTAIGFLATRESRNAFAERVRAVRNYLTHYDPNEEVEVAPLELFYLTRKLELLVKICLLEEVGLSLDEIEKTMQGRTRYRELFQSE